MDHEVPPNHFKLTRSAPPSSESALKVWIYLLYAAGPDL